MAFVAVRCFFLSASQPGCVTYQVARKTTNPAVTDHVAATLSAMNKATKSGRRP